MRNENPVVNTIVGHFEDTAENIVTVFNTVSVTLGGCIVKIRVTTANIIISRFDESVQLSQKDWCLNDIDQAVAQVIGNDRGNRSFMGHGNRQLSHAKSTIDEFMRLNPEANIMVEQVEGELVIKFTTEQKINLIETEEV